MDNLVLTNNKEALNNKFPAWIEMLEPKNEYALEEHEYPVEIDYGKDGIPALYVIDGERKKYLDGKYGPENTMDFWLEKNEKIEDFSTVIVIGIHNALHIKKLLDVVSNKVNILVYEPSLEVFRKAFETADMTYLFTDNVPLGIIVEGINDNEISEYLQSFITFENMLMLKIYISGNYDVLYSDKVSSFVKEIRKRVDSVSICWNTTVRYTSVNAINQFSNIKYYYNQHSIRSLYNILPSDIPTIIVSAGPSLNNNIIELKKAVGKACIIATDTAMKPLLNSGIRPNLFVVVDGLKPGLLFQHKDISKIPMVTYVSVAEEPMKIHKGKKFFIDGDSALENGMVDYLEKNGAIAKGLIAISTGGSVANTCFSLGSFMGSKTIILMGQDLAMTGNRTHADGTFQEKMDEIDTNSTEYFEVEANDGGKVLTRADFNHYRKWFEERIREWSGLRVINATEGGAKINGAEVMTLHDAIEETCKKEINIAWKISHSPKYLNNDKERQYFLSFLSDVPNRINDVRNKAKKGIGYYNKLLKLSNKKGYKTNELEKVLKKITSINKFMENDYMALTMSESLKGVEYTLRAQMYNTEEKESDEMKDIAKQGILLLQDILNVADQFEVLAEKTILKFYHKEMKKYKK